MKNTLLIFFLTFLVAFGGGYLYYQSKAPAEVATEESNTEGSDTESVEEIDEGSSEAVTVAEGEIFVERGCIGCHSISELGIEGAVTGPDLSQAYNNVEGKFGMTIEEYLKAPTSAVMSSVLGEGGDPLSEEELEKVLEGLRKAAGQ